MSHLCPPQEVNGGDPHLGGIDLHVFTCTACGSKYLWFLGEEMKRSRDGDNQNHPTPPSKRLCTDSQLTLKAKYRQPGDLLLPANPQDPAVLDGLTDRSLAVILHCAGFDAVKADALESLRNVMDSYLTHLTELMHIAMTASRRRKPVAHDVMFALNYSNASLDSLLPDVKPSAQKRPPGLQTVRQTVQPPLYPSPISTSTAQDFDFTAAAQLSMSLGGNADKALKRYIPSHFPSFPPPHTYKASAVPIAERENDARKIRERATQEGVLAERALRKLVQAREGAHRPSSRQGLSEKNEAVFREAMEAVLREDEEKGRESLQQEDELLFLDEGELQMRKEEEEGKRKGLQHEDAQPADFGFGAVVNYDRAHWRSGARDIFGAA